MKPRVHVILLAVLAALARSPGRGRRAVHGHRDDEAKRLSDPQVSPDGRWVLYTPTEVDLAAATRNSDLWLVPARRRASRAASPRTRSRTPAAASAPTAGGSRSCPRATAAAQVYVMDAGGRRAAQGHVAAPPAPAACCGSTTSTLLVDLRRLSRLRAPTPSLQQEEDGRGRQALDARVPTTRCSSATGTPGRTAGAATCSWCPLDGGGPRDLTPGGARRAAASAWAGPTTTRSRPTGKEVCFARNDDPVPATSTNAELFVVPAAAGRRARSPGSPGYDGAPQYSPDGTPHRVPRAEARRLRGGPLAADGLRPARRERCGT